jgi:hypothetical protein
MTGARGLSVWMWSAVLAAAIIAPGCGQPKKTYSQSQLIELQSRFVSSPPDKTYDAAVQALLDAQYAINSSDKRGGVMAASKMFGNHGDDVFGAHIRNIMLTVTVAPAPGGSTVRVSTLVDGRSGVDEAAIKEFQDTLQRRVDLFAEKAGGGTP